MDISDFTLPCDKPEHFGATSWLGWANHMRTAIDAKRRRETHRIRTWENLTRGDAARAAALVVAGGPDMGRLLALLDFLERRAEHVELRVFRALGLFDGELKPPPLPPELAGVTAEDAAKLMGGAPAWALLFDGRQRKQQQPEQAKPRDPETGRKGKPDAEINRNNVSVDSMKQPKGNSSASGMRKLQKAGATEPTKPRRRRRTEGA